MVNFLMKSRRRTAPILLLVVLVVLGVVYTSPAAAQTQGSGGFGIGSGDGLETGIRLSVLNQVRADIAAGVYDRACTEAEHDPTKWHSLVNTQAKCHYDHHHGDDPNYVNDIFGEPGAWFQNPGQSISYPWQTFPATSRNESNAAYQNGLMENQTKHEGYYWIVRRDQPCNTADGQYCVKDFRVQFHGMFLGPGDVAARWHSMSAELRACRNVNDLSTCGIVRTGGWMDHGRLLIPSNNSTTCGVVNGLQHIPLPSDSQYYPFQTNSNPLDEQRCHPVLTPQMIAAGPQTGRVTGAKAEWWVHGASDFRFQLQVANPIGNILETSPGSGQLQNVLFCQYSDADCKWNQSIMTMRIQYTLNINSYYVEGFVNNGRAMLPLGRRYISRFGGINTSCTAPGLDCIPIEYNNLPLSVSFGQGAPRFSHTPCENCQKVDYDLSPAGKQWLTWFYTKYGHAPLPQPEPEPQPEPQPEDPTGPAIYFHVNKPTDSQVDVAVRLIGVNNVFGIQTECKVNPQILQGAALVEGDGFSQANSFIINNGFQADGLWRIGATRLKPNAAISGNAVAYTLGYNVAAAGDGQLECSALAVDENGTQITLEVVNGTVMIPPVAEPQPQPQPPVATEEPPILVELGTISGLAAYQNRPNNGGITIKLLGVANQPITEVTTNADGTYSFPELPIGDYTLQLSAPQHLTVLKPVVIETANATVQLNDLLRAGDVDNNGIINMADITLLGANFGLQAIPEIANADLNADGWVNISDLSLAGGNLDLAGPLTP